MLRSGFILGVSAPAALLTVLIQPVVRETADRWTPPVLTAAAAVQAPLPGMRPASLALSPTRVAGVQRVDSRSGSVAEEGQEIGIRPLLKQPQQPRRLVREGCETALSSLVGPEARRMIPGRCIS
ncbi:MULTISPECIES: hypothetical protein [unclassified Methylobacterium]|uniref:hypothetical protein n=1 Tax=unclassified Methylobacterium TaxID=2615210 RepID=UPI0011C1E054|nr:MULTISPECIES: hypothetical protein [unclassified Methylobacterium]QEE42197.1 hypothetical protein FVA80_27985 [Methylobacterium sp. WL1]TXN57595.1 hypothetical protein FV241_10700 [Methylobacterium sp. WL2]